MSLLVALATFPAGACEGGSVRLAAFNNPRDVHKLCVIANTEDTAADGLYADLSDLLALKAADLNVELVRVNADDPQVVWAALSLPSAPPVLPVTVLVGWDSVNRRPFFIDYWEPGPTEDELATLARSDVREAIKRGVVAYWAVLLYARGTGENSGAVDAVVDAAVGKWAVDQPPGITVAHMDRTDPKERTLRAFIGLPPSGPDWVGVVFGRGKLTAPPLEGTAITEDNLNKLIGGLLEPCTCLVDGTSLGVDIPMVWGESQDEAVVALGSDGYIEVGAGAFMPATVQASTAPEVSRRVPLTALIALGASAMLAVLGTGAVLWRSRERNSAPSQE